MINNKIDTTNDRGRLPLGQSPRSRAFFKKAAHPNKGASLEIKGPFFDFGSQKVVFEHHIKSSDFRTKSYTKYSVKIDEMALKLPSF